MSKSVNIVLRSESERNRQEKLVEQFGNLLAVAPPLPDVLDLDLHTTAKRQLIFGFTK